MKSHTPLAKVIEDIAPMGQLEVRSPFDEELLGTVDQAGAAHVERALSNAKALYDDRTAWLPRHRRITILEQTASLMQRDFDRLVQIAASEGGKPFPDTVVEVKRAIESVRLAAASAAHDEGEVVPLNNSAMTAGRVGFTQLEPIGPVVAVSAFNHPLNLIAHQGCTGSCGRLSGHCEAGRRYPAVLLRAGRLDDRSRVAVGVGGRFNHG